MKMEMATPEFLAACRHVLGADDPRTVLTAMRERDPRMQEVWILVHRDPARWFCSAIDCNGIHRVWAKGDNELEVRRRAEQAACDYAQRKPWNMYFSAAWTFVTYPPDTA
jgi:hypothetical protein